MQYPEGMTVEVTFSPTLQTFHAAVLVRDGEDEYFGFSSQWLSSALQQLADEVKHKFER